MRIITKAKRYHKAAREGTVRILKEANRWEVNAQDESGLTPLLCAAGEGHVEAVRVLLKRKAKMCAVDGFGNSALHLAAARGHLECVKVLVAKGANLYGLDGGQRTACELARIGEWDEVVEFLERMVKVLEGRNPKRVLKLKKLAGERYEKMKDVVQEGNIGFRRQESNEYGEREGVERTEDLNSGEEGSSDEKCPDVTDVQRENSHLLGLLVHKSNGLSASTSKSTARSYLVFSELIKEQSINQTIVNSLETRPQPVHAPQPTPLPEEDPVESALRAFLELYDLQRIHRQLQDKGLLNLSQLMTMTEHDIKAALALPLGPHRKLCVALEEYKSTQKWDGP
ncbi:Usher syndrome type-1G protein homolog [Culex quinquefasciatus]|uniref:Usher syndrome type-1G protein homolog n=1 Tax=Culex quinquefasciatus TaxID=7176 RepID=UPI0018E2BD3E|nr:Usher syndrome type-1G protein homolog [Culex quinquefasciatus]